MASKRESYSGLLALLLLPTYYGSPNFYHHTSYTVSALIVSHCSLLIDTVIQPHQKSPNRIQLHYPSYLSSPVSRASRRFRLRLPLVGCPPYPTVLITSNYRREL
jgi:hypothetical protein